MEDESNDKNEDLVPEILPRYQSFYESYPDLFGWICIPGTEID